MKVTYESTTKYLGYAVVMILLALADMGKSIAMLHTGLYVALIFARESMTLVSIIYVLASLIVSPTIEGLIASIVPVIVMVGTRLILMRFKRRMNVFVATMGGIVSLIPMVVYSVIRSDNLAVSLIRLIITAVFTYLCIVAVFAFVVKKLRFNLSSDECIAFLILVAVIAMGIYNINIYDFRIYYIIMAVLVLVSSSILRLGITMSLGVAYGAGAAIIMGNLELAGIICMMSIICYTFNRYNKYFGAISYVALDLLFLAYFRSYESNTYLHLIASLVGCVIFLIIPSKKIRYWRGLYGNSDRGSAIQSFINRNRIDVNAKITNLAGVLSDIEAELTRGQYVATDKKWKSSIASAIMCKECGDCENRATCFKALGGDTLSQIRPLVDKAVDAKVTEDDVSMFLESRCVRKEELVALASDYATRYKETSIHTYDVLDNNRILGEQIGSIGKLLDKLSRGILEGVSEGSELEGRIKEELGIMGIVCHDVLVMEKTNGDVEITLVVRSRDKNKRCIRNILESLTHIKLEKAEDRCCELEGFTTIRFTPRPKFVLSYGVASETKEGSAASGDTRSAVKLARHLVALTLCDGKGSGTLASINSNNTINIIEKLYKAGFDSATILAFSNRILSIRSSEDFSALDLAVVDLSRAGVDFIKLGGVTSYIKRASSVETIEGSSLPIGVLEEAVPSTTSRLLSEGDIVVMVSDGMTDSIGSEAIGRLLLNTSTHNVQTIADELVAYATEQGAIDDTTVIAFTLTKA